MIRILDSRREEFRLSKAYEQKIDVVNVITAPEIEMLIIHAEGAYDQFKRSGKKPSELMLSRLVDTFFSRTSWTMLLYAENHSISVA